MTKPKISVLHPSYGRPALAMEAFLDWSTSSVYEVGEKIEYILSLSVKDPKLNEYKELFKDFEVSGIVRIIYSPYASMIEQVNLAAAYSGGNLIINTSDDFRTPKNWDTLLLNALEGKEDYIVKTQDGIQPEIMTLPMMDRKYYERFEYIYPYEYKHFYGDEEIAEVGKILGKTITLDILFPHKHYTVGGMKKDATNIKNDKNFGADKKTFEARKKRNFDL